nr:ISL3 family transposase [Hydrogenibacillus sp. N12]
MLTPVRHAARCPKCHHRSQNIHSRYIRSPRDLPISGRAVQLRIVSRRFICRNPACSQQIFTERFPSFLDPRQRRTCRAAAVMRAVALALGGEAGARLCQRLGLSVSPDTLLRLLYGMSVPPDSHPRIIGIDDWAYRKGHRYGTIICDLECRQPVALLPDRAVDTVVAWLRQHPEIQVIARDRAGSYAEAARQGCPQALQVADRWHLLHNLSDLVKRLLDRCPAPVLETDAPAATEGPDMSPSTVFREPTARKREMAEHIRRLSQEGLGKRAIARALSISRNTVRKYLQADPRPYSRPRRSTLLSPYEADIEALLAEGKKGPFILQRLREKGYRGSRSTLSAYLARVRRERYSKHHDSPVRVQRRPGRREMARLLRQPEDAYTDEQRRMWTAWAQDQPWLAEARELIQSFEAMVRRREADRLVAWLKQAEHSSVAEIRSFARSIRQDVEAVEQALRLPWSNGQVEGQIHRLKMLKRQMYGRAGFDLLRIRVLARI